MSESTTTAPLRFADIPLHATVQDSLAAMGFDSPTPIQAQAIPLVLEGKDIIGTAQTGTGKTAAFLLPIISRLAEQEEKGTRQKKGINTLIIAPTRELAMQIDQQLEGFGYFCPISSIAVYGGSGGDVFEREKRALSSDVDFVVATPGRLLSHLAMRYVDFSHLEHLVLDEADRMLDMGFFDDIMKIVNTTPDTRQTLLFSATMPPKIRKLSETILKDPSSISIAISKPAERVNQRAFMVHDMDKLKLIEGLFHDGDPRSTIVFCSTKRDVAAVARQLQKLSFSAEAFHSGILQEERERLLAKFKNREVKILVATDILSRGIDIEDIDLVVNYEVPRDPEDYIHRIGRTARAAAKGEAITFINEYDMGQFGRIEKLMEREVEKEPLPEGMPEGPVYDPNKRDGGRRPSSSGGSRYEGGNRSGGGRSGGGSGRSGGGRGRGGYQSGGKSEG